MCVGVNPHRHICTPISRTLGLTVEWIFQVCLGFCFPNASSGFSSLEADDIATGQGSIPKVKVKVKVKGDAEA